ncbi:alpha/beta fold hydrolase [Nocardia pseudobrasiliensis]|uniref:Pimeloyl-ACP methyl ester carboxylesterase n=1 Tax=Nocardia pseudobrasiliensis TaxID=45979 RepID=A0A370HP77_9NOCA|nr:alpha/beta fold hydrolase [Nocardia pseudobrasiliensis]RDI60339.1 pimeloyl-ACP methyl ester carboxylesterase [Nocardia pseudobrasiliensis]
MTSAEPLFVRRSGSGPAVMLIHGGLPPDMTWSRQDALAARWSLIVPSRRGFSPSPSAATQDFLVDAVDLTDLVESVPGGAHLVGFSYGGLSACLVAERVPRRVRSLTLIEAPLWIAAEDDASVRELADLSERFATSADDARAEQEFFALVGLDPADRSESLRQAIALGRAMRSPWEAAPRFESIVAADVPALIVSGDHHPALELLSDRLADRLRAQRVRLPGAGHGVPQAPGFNAVLEEFLARAEISVPDRKI